MKRARWIPVLIAAAGVLTSCGDGLAPPTTGSIALQIRFAQAQAGLAAPSLARGAAAAQDTSSGAKPPELSVAAYTSAHATASGGPSSASVDLTLNAGFWEGELTNLKEGTYTVTVEGFVDGDLAAKGVTSGVSVTAGKQATASVTLASVIPTLSLGIGSPTTSLEIPVSVSTVDAATGYRIQWSTNPDFTGAGSKDLTGTSGTVSVSALGSYNLRARALVDGAAGAASAVVTLDVAGDTPATGDDAASALALGFGPSSNQQLTNLNIAPAGDQDWFALDACRYDTVIVETFAARLNPASKLNTLLRLFSVNGTVQEAENDDLDGTTTDSRITAVLGGEGTYSIQVTGVNNTVGRYELGVEVKKGVNDDGTQCKPITVVVAPSSKTLAPGATQQFTATATDASGNTFTGLKYLWLSGNTNVAIVDTTGLVTAVGGGTTTITAAGQGEPGYAQVTVTGPALGTPTQLAFSVQPATTTAGAAFSPAIEVEVRDANGNRVTGARNAVTLAIGTNPGSATLTGTKTVNANLGIARFTGLYMDKAASGYTITATSSGLTAATSGAFVINPGLPSRLTFGTQPADVEGNTTFASAVTVSISDQFGNVVPTASNSVTLGFESSPWRSVFSAGGALGGTTTKAAVNGVATFDDLRVDKPGPGYSLLGRATGLDSAISVPFSVGLTVSAVAVSSYSGYSTCAVAMAGTYCWGYNNQGQLGGGATGTVDSVAALVSGGPFVKVAVGGAHACGLTAAGAAYCWGDNSQGQLGNGMAPNDSPVPVAVSGGLTFASIAAGYQHTCAVTTAGAAYCWGANSNGQLGLAPLPSVAETESNNTAGTADAITIGNAGTGSVDPAGDVDYWVFAATAGTALDINVDARKIGSTLDPTLTLYASDGTTQLAFNDDYDGLDSRIRYTVSTSGNYYAAVRAYAGGGGTGQTYRVNFNTAASAPQTPRPVTGSLTFASITAGYLHTCGITTGGDAYCWGWDAYGGLGDDAAFADKSVPTVVSGGMTWGSISAGAAHTCARTSGGVGYCWGYNQYGQVGNNSTTSIGTPQAVNGGLTFASISAGGFHSCGVLANGDGYCWGQDQYGQLGDNQPGTTSMVPVLVSGGLTFNTIFAGTYHTCGRAGTEVYCWGFNNAGQLGNGETATTRPTPVHIVQ